MKCTMTVANNKIKNDSIVAKTPTTIARYLPRKESPIHPATGSNTHGPVHTMTCFVIRKKIREVVVTIKPPAALSSMLHTSKSSMPLETGLKLWHFGFIFCKSVVLYKNHHFYYIVVVKLMMLPPAHPAL